MAISKRNITYNLQVNKIAIEELSSFSYLGAEFLIKRNLKEEVKSQEVKGARISGCLYNMEEQIDYRNAHSHTGRQKIMVKNDLF